MAQARILPAFLPIAAVLLVAGAPQSFAALRYVGPSGSSANPGTAQSPWSLAHANATLVAGDVCILLPGSYSTGINPVNSGTAGNRITYVGSLTNPASTAVAGLAITKAWITVKGVQTGGHIALDYPARYDSVAWCIANGGHFYGAKYSMIARNVINGHFEFALNGAQTMGGTANSEYDTLRGNRIAIGDITGNAHGFKLRGFTQNCLIDSNRVTGTFVQTGTTDAGGRMFYNSYYVTLRDNSWEFNATGKYNANNDAWNGFVIRDSCHHLLFERDTVLLGLANDFPVRGVLASSGSFGNTRDNTWRRCVLKANAYFWVQDWLRNCTLEYNVIASRNDIAFWALNSINGGSIHHNTFWAPNQCANFAQSFQSPTQIHSNIFYGVSAGPIGSGGAILQYAANATGNIVQNQNLFFTRTFNSTPGDRSLEWCCYTGSAPGPGTPWFNRTGQDAASRHGSPRFRDSTFATLDVRLQAGSPAIGMGLGGTDAGAIPFSTGGTDVTPPAAVTNLAAGQVTDRSLVLTWTAPGDNGTVGLAAAYDLRYSTSPITSANFGSAIAVLTPPVPLPAGTGQSYVMLNLSPTTTYYFALKTRDSAGNWSALSNVPAATTTADVTPPAAVQDLRTGP